MPGYPDFAREVEGPFVITFTAHLPFPIGIPNDLGHSIWLDHPFVDEAYEAVYKRPFVNIRVFDLTQSGLPVWEKGTCEALKNFYNFDLEDDPVGRYGEDAFIEHNQWVTLETPWGALQGYDLDPFHRCLDVFNSFLQATLLITRNIRVRMLASHDLRPVVIIGAWPKGGKWRELTSMYMHPEAVRESLLTVDKPFDQDELNRALSAMVNQKPYITTIMWRTRAQRALRQTGEGADAVISFQIAAESLLFETYRMLLVDEGMSSDEIRAELEKDRPFKRFFTVILPARLGGDWQVDHSGTPIGNYWKDLYLVRNSIIHTGMMAHTGHAEAAQKAYSGLRDHLETRLWAKHKTYPRTIYARLGREQLEAKGWLTPWMRQFIEQADAETGIWYWPWDLANRQPAPSGK
jgi:Apea-like HEPN